MNKKFVTITTMCSCLISLYIVHMQGIYYDELLTSIILFSVSIVAGEIWSVVNKPKAKSK